MFFNVFLVFFLMFLSVFLFRATNQVPFRGDSHPMGAFFLFQKADIGGVHRAVF